MGRTAPVPLYGPQGDAAAVAETTKGTVLNHYPHHIGDYLKDTAHLDALEDGIYRRALDLYYMLERPLEPDLERLCRRLRLEPKKQGGILSRVLEEFFTLEADGWRHSRCDLEIAKYQEKAAANRKNGKAGGRPKRTEQEPKNNPDGFQESTDTGTQKNLNQNQNHQPLNSKAERSPKGSRLQEIEIPSQWAAFCKTERPELDPLKTFDGFRDYWIAQPKGVKLDWFATWRNWVRNQKTNGAAHGSSGKFNVFKSNREALARALAEEKLGGPVASQIFDVVPTEVHDKLS